MSRRTAVAAILAVACLLASRVATASAAEEKITYQEHIRPIFTASCTGCHNPDKNKAGLDLTNYQGALAGSSNGKVISPGDPDGSLLYLAVTHQQEPRMPKGGSKLADAKLELIRKWIAAGAPENANSKVAAAVAKSGLEMNPAVAPTSHPAG